MKKIKLIALAGSVLVFVISLTGPFSKGKNINTQVKDVVVAVVDIPQQTIIKSEMLEVKPMLETALTDTVVYDLESAIGTVSITDIYTKDVITQSKISEPGSQKSGVSYLIPKGERAITIDVQASSGIAGLIRVGNHVDIINIADEKATMLLQDKKVLALDKKIKDEQKEIVQDQGIYVTITLAVTPEEALKLSLGDEVGVNRAILRNPEDSDINSLSEVKK